MRPRSSLHQCLERILRKYCSALLYQNVNMQMGELGRAFAGRIGLSVMVLMVVVLLSSPADAGCFHSGQIGSKKHAREAVDRFWKQHPQGKRLCKGDVRNTKISDNFQFDGYHYNIVIRRSCKGCGRIHRNLTDAALPALCDWVSCVGLCHKVPTHTQGVEDTFYKDWYVKIDPNGD